MKIALLSLAFVLVALSCGCTDHPPVTVPVSAAVPVSQPGTPNLLGTWTGPMQGFDEGSGFSEYPGLRILMNVTEQKGRIFTGTVVFIANGTATESGFAGAIGHNGKTLTIAERNGGYCTGEILGENEIELIYMQDGSPYSIAIDSFRRV